MKLDDVKWALGELAAAVIRNPHRNCDCHPRLNYRPRAQQEDDAGEIGKTGEVSAVAHPHPYPPHKGEGDASVSESPPPCGEGKGGGSLRPPVIRKSSA